MKDLLELKKNLKKDFSELKLIKTAVLGDTSTQFLVQALRGLGFDYGLNLEIWESDFDQIKRQIYDQSSELYNFEPEIIILFQSSHKLLLKYNKLNRKDQNSLASEELDQIHKQFEALNVKLKCKVIYYNYTEIDDAVFGNYSNKIEGYFFISAAQTEL